MVTAVLATSRVVMHSGQLDRSGTPTGVAGKPDHQFLRVRMYLRRAAPTATEPASDVARNQPRPSPDFQLASGHHQPVPFGMRDEGPVGGTRLRFARHGR